MTTTLILGGARSGKSRCAESLALAITADRYLYLATAPHIDGDGEWSARIDRHRRDRDDRWSLVEEEIMLTRVLHEQATAGRVVLVDCLTPWLSNLLFAGHDVGREAEKLCGLLPALDGDVILVSNEVGMGLVPDSAEGRVFRDAQGRLNQAVAAVADRVEFVAAGLPICLKE